MIELLTIFGFGALATSSVGLAIKNRFPARLKATAAPVRVAPVEPVLVKTVPAAIVDDWAADEPASLPARRNVRLRRSGVAKEKILERFVAWMISECYSGWHTSAGVYDAFKDFAYEERFEELDRGTFLSLLSVELGIEKRRAYIDKNDTYRHLRRAARSQGRAVVYRIPTAEELAAARHKRALKDAETRQRMRVPKARPEPGVQQHPRGAPASETGLKNKGLGVDASVFDVAA
ncbi:hypothetical protein [Hyphomicrobium sp. ghe19]|uniref:hypothetical protein n=1 Tax=Hyphomicrobium sp. ghe19 TaxID=2682968 RepID=UPI0013673334|nr:hypothetical protein HYPP_03827 [Hyphomicrobium sp. ghe19]